MKKLLPALLLFVCCLTSAQEMMDEPKQTLVIDMLSSRSLNPNGSAILPATSQQQPAFFNTNSEEGSGVLDSIIQYMWNSELNDWIYFSEACRDCSQSFYRKLFTYDVNGLLNTITKYSTEGVIISVEFKTDESYDANGNPTLYLGYRWDKDNGQWLNVFKQEYSYDENGNQTVYEYYDWDAINGQWVLGVLDWKYEYSYDETYDANGNLTVEEYWDAVNGQWINDSKDEYSYDKNGNLTVAVRYWQWDDEWDFINKSIITFNVNGDKETSVSYYWDEYNSEWVSRIKTNWHYSNSIVAYTLSVNTNALDIDSDENSTATFNITSNTDWTISGLESWLSTSDNAGLGDAEITLTTEENVSSEPRTDTIAVSGTGVDDQIIVITQNGSTVGISNLNYSDITIYPNPTNGIITIDICNPYNADIEIYNTNGSLIYSKDLISIQEQIDLSAYPKGMYFIKVRQQGTMKVGKVVLE